MPKSIDNSYNPVNAFNEWLDTIVDDKTRKSIRDRYPPKLNRTKQTYKKILPALLSDSKTLSDNVRKKILFSDIKNDDFAPVDVFSLLPKFKKTLKCAFNLTLPASLVLNKAELVWIEAGAELNASQSVVKRFRLEKGIADSLVQKIVKVLCTRDRRYSELPLAICRDHSRKLSHLCHTKAEVQNFVYNLVLKWNSTHSKETESIQKFVRPSGKFPWKVRCVFKKITKNKSISFISDKTYHIQGKYQDHIAKVSCPKSSLIHYDAGTRYGKVEAAFIKFIEKYPTSFDFIVVDFVLDSHKKIWCLNVKALSLSNDVTSKISGMITKTNQKALMKKKKPYCFGDFCNVVDENITSDFETFVKSSGIQPLLRIPYRIITFDRIQRKKNEEKDVASFKYLTKRDSYNMRNFDFVTVCVKCFKMYKSMQKSRSRVNKKNIKSKRLTPIDFKKVKRKVTNSNSAGIDNNEIKYPGQPADGDKPESTENYLTVYGNIEKDGNKENISLESNISLNKQYMSDQEIKWNFDVDIHIADLRRKIGAIHMPFSP